MIFKIFYLKTKDFSALKNLLELFIDKEEIALDYYLEKLNNMINISKKYLYYEKEPLSNFLSIFLNKLKENNREDEIEKIFNLLSDNIIDKEQLINLFCFLFQNFENEKLLNFIIKTLNNNKILLNQVLNIIKDETKRKKFLENLNNEYIINDSDFFEDKNSENLLILIKLNEKDENIFNLEEYSDFNYVKKTKEKLNKIKEIIKNEEINFNQTKSISNNNNKIFNRIKILFITESELNKKNEYYKTEETNIEKKIQEIKDYYDNIIKNFWDKLNILIEIYKKYFINEKNEIEELEKIKEKIERGNLQEIKTIIDENKKLIEEKSKLNNLLINEKNSKFFNILFDINKINDPNSTVKNCQEEYNEFDKIFGGNPKISYQILNKLEKFYDNDKHNFFDEMKEEIAILKRIFYHPETLNHDLEDNKKLLFIRLKKNFFIKQLDNVINFFNNYSNDEKDKINIFDKLEIIKEKINEKDLTLDKVKKFMIKLINIYQFLNIYIIQIML